MKEPNDVQGRPKTDEKNPDSRLHWYVEEHKTTYAGNGFGNTLNCKYLTSVHKPYILSIQDTSRLEDLKGYLTHECLFYIFCQLSQSALV